MRRLARARRSAGSAGIPLPDIFPPLRDKGIRIRRAQVTLVVAPPNSGKSLFALYCGVRWAQQGLGVLYFSADTDEADNYKRMAAMLTGHTQSTVERELEGDSPALDFYDELIDEVNHLRFDFETDPGYSDIIDGVLAFSELWGEYPAVVIVDNLGNVVPGSDDEWKSLHETIKFCKRMGRLTGAAVVVPHHVNETLNDPIYPASRKDITGKVGKYPDGIISLLLVDSINELRVASVKNRGAKKSADGKDYATLYVDADRMRFFASEYEKRQGNPI